MLIYYLIALALVGIDQYIKYLTLENIALHEVKEFLPGLMSLTYIQNTGAAMSILEGKMMFFYIVTVIVIGSIVYMFYKYGKEQPLFSTALAFILGGAVGNFIDRLRFEYVVDMFKLEFINFPIFNFADAALTVGVILMMIQIFLEEKTTKRNMY